MKALFSVLFGLILSQANTQILLEEARVNLQPLKVDQVSNQLTLVLPESTYGEFQKDPLEFARKHFDMPSFIAKNKRRNFSSYEVSFKSSKGALLARYNKHGEIRYSRQNFKNVLLPDDIRMALYSNYGKNQVLSNRYLAFSKGWDIQKEIYHVKIKEGDKTKRLKFQRNGKGLVFASL